MAHKIRLVVDQNFDRFLTSIFGRFWVVLGRQVGIIFGPFGGQVGPSSVQKASWKRIIIKNVNFHETLRLPIPQRYLEPQDGSQNGSRSVQDGSKRLLKSNFFALEIHLKFCPVLGAILARFWLSFGALSTLDSRTIFALEIDLLFLELRLPSWSPPSRPQRRPRDLQKDSRGAQEAPRLPQEAPKSTPGGSKRASRDPK